MKSLDGNDYIGQRPHPAFAALIPFVVRYVIEEDVKNFLELTIYVNDGEVRIAEANFSDDCGGTFCQNVLVQPPYQRRGIATALYVLAESLFGKTLSNSLWDESDQSKAARALWAQPNRPFGSPKQ
jgi:GNAT superfamily N-acetyltransferase